MAYDDDDGDEYVDVDVEFVHCTDKAVCVREDSQSDTVWVPRSCLHAKSDIEVDDCDRYDPITLTMRRWKAEELGLL
jgi:hypothetical protein